MRKITEKSAANVILKRQIYISKIYFRLRYLMIPIEVSGAFMDYEVVMYNSTWLLIASKEYELFF